MTIAERLIQKGALEVAREIACRLRDMGWTPERIQEATGLSGEELKKLFPDEQYCTVHAGDGMPGDSAQDSARCFR